MPFLLKLSVFQRITVTFFNLEEQIYDCSDGILLPFSFQQTIMSSQQKKPQLLSVLLFSYLQVWGRRGKKPKQPQKTTQRTGKCFQVIFCFIPDLPLSVIQACQGTSWTQAASCCGSTHWHLLQLVAPSGVCFSFQLPSVLWEATGSLGLCSAAAPPQPGSSPTRLAQVFQTCSSVQNRICHSALLVWDVW